MAGLNTTGGGAGGGAGAIRAGRSFVEMFLDDSKMIRSLEKLKNRFQGFGSTLLKIGGVTAGVGASILGTLGGIFFETAKHFDDVNDAATRLGTTPEIFTNLGHAAEMSGSSAEDLESSLGKMQKTLVDAAKNGGQSEAAFKALGLSAKDLVALPLDEQMEAIAQALSDVENPTHKGALAMNIFGKSGRALLPMLEDGAEGLRAFRKQNQLLGNEVSGENAKKGAAAMDAFDIAMKSLKGTVRAVGAALLPTVEQIEAFQNWIIMAGGTVRRFIADNRAAILSVAAVGAGLWAAGLAIIALGLGFTLAGSVIGGFVAAAVAIKAVILAIVSPIGLAVIAIAALAAGLVYLFSLTESGQGLFASLRAGFGELVDDVKAMLGGIGDALKVGDFRLAGKIAFVGLMLEFAKAIAFIQDKWNGFKGFFVDGFHDAIMLIRLAMNDFGAWFTDQFFNIFKLVNEKFGETLRAMLSAAGDIAAGLGAKQDAETFRFLANTPKGLLNSAIDTAKAKNEQDRKDQNNKIHNDAFDAQKARDAAREKDLNDAKADVKKIGDMLNGLVGQAAKQLADKLLKDTALAAAGFAIKFLFGKRRSDQLSELGDSVKGGFGGANARQIFAFGDKSVQEKTLEATEQVATNTKEIGKKIDGLDGVGFSA